MPHGKPASRWAPPDSSFAPSSRKSFWPKWRRVWPKEKEVIIAIILAVDDDAAARDLLVTVLGYAGHEVRQAADGAEALALAQDAPPDLIIADLLMPTMDGFEFVRRLRENSAFARTPVVFYTATYLESEARTLASQCGVTHIITKPAEPEQILKTV